MNGNNRMTDKEIYILGIGRNTVTVMDLAEDCGYKIAGLLHYNFDRIGESYFGLSIIGCFEDVLQNESLKGMIFALSMGNLRIRSELYDKIISKGGEIPSLIHPSCVVSRRATIGNGVQIMPGSIVQGDTIVGNDTVITVNSVVAHSAKVGKHCLISGQVMVGAYSTVDDMTHIGQGSTIVSGKVNRVGSNCILGAGAVLLNDMPDNSIYVGNPAHILKYRDKHYVF